MDTDKLDAAAARFDNLNSRMDAVMRDDAAGAAEPDWLRKIPVADRPKKANYIANMSFKMGQKARAAAKGSS